MLTSSQYDKDALTVAPVRDAGEDWQARARLNVLHLECNVTNLGSTSKAEQTGVDKRPMYAGT
jgi:hypothetical protein